MERCALLTQAFRCVSPLCRSSARPYADVKLKGRGGGGRPFPFNAAMLAAASPVFKEALGGQFEWAEAMPTLTLDCSNATLRNLLSLIATGRVQKADQGDLKELADWIAFLGLSRRCRFCQLVVADDQGAVKEHFERHRNAVRENAIKIIKSKDMVLPNEMACPLCKEVRKSKALLNSTNLSISFRPSTSSTRTATSKCNLLRLTAGAATGASRRKWRD